MFEEDHRLWLVQEEERSEPNVLSTKVPPSKFGGCFCQNCQKAMRLVDARDALEGYSASRDWNAEPFCEADVNVLCPTRAAKAAAEAEAN